jgi:hypothetical protein
MIFAVSFEIIIQRAVSNESCYPMKNTLIITVLSNISRKNALLCGLDAVSPFIINRLH